jgi:hypothetical protein
MKTTTPETPVMIFVVAVLVLTTCIATGVVKVPMWATKSYITAIVLVILSLGAFSKDPMLGVSFFLLTAVILFSRNVNTTAAKIQNFTAHIEADTNEPFFDLPMEAPKASVVNSITTNNAGNAVLAPTTDSDNSQNSTLNTFLDQHRAASDGSAVNRSLGVYGEETIMKEGPMTAREFSTFVSSPRGYNQFNETSGLVEGFTSDQASFSVVSTPTDGQYPIEESRPFATAESRDYTYRPDSDTGSNSFQRSGPDLDEKKDAFQYK